MDELSFTLAGFAILMFLIYLTGVLFAVCEYKRWKPTGWLIPLAVIMLVVTPFIFPVVVHVVKPRMRACGVDRLIIRFKLVLAWFVPFLTSVGCTLCLYFCNRVVNSDFSEELATCCTLSCVCLYLVLMIWMNAQLNALAASCPAKETR